MANLKLTHPKLKSIALIAAMAVGSADVSALGLGTLEVQSNLDQPFDGEIELRVAQGDDLGSVVANIASQEDFANLNIDYPGYLSDMMLTVESVGGENILRVTSNDVVIKEPFIHFLIRVDWSGGSFLREYTALIDPPVYASETPAVLSQPRIVGVDQSSGNQIIDTPVYENQNISEDENDFTDTLSSNTGQSYQTSSSTDAQYGPVAQGETLSQIAQDLQEQFPDLSIYQIMKVLFDENQTSFIDRNINGLMEGVVLNVADLNTIRSVDVAESKQFFYEQINSWDPTSLISDGESAVKVGQDDYLYSDDNTTGDDFSSSFDTNSNNDTFQVGSTSNTQSFVSDAQGSDAEGEVIALQQEVTDLQTSLSSSSLENQELRERISILEGQLADMNRLMSLNVEDADLANLESNLQAQNQANLVQEELDALTDSGVVLDSDGSLLDDGTLADGSLSDLADGSLLADGTLSDLADSSLLADGTLSDLDDGSLLAEGSLSDLADGSLPADGSLSDLADGSLPADGSLLADGSLSVLVGDSDLVEDVQTNVTENIPAVVTLSSKPSFFDSILDNGLLKVFGGLGAVILAGLGLLFYRRRRADEEFEVSMMTIESHDTADAETNASLASAATISRSESASSQDKSSQTVDGASQNEETSFLTVYSDSDAVVQADEVDPIAEADVYIAYGRDEQAEEVLLDGVASNPTRVDIKHKLLSLYHKNGNNEGFERISEELYAQKDLIGPDLWQEVSLMGKDLLPDNPMFDMSPSELSIDAELNETETDSSAEIEEQDVSVKLEETSDSVELDNLELDSVELDSVELDSVAIGDVEVAPEVIDSDDLNIDLVPKENDNDANLINFSEETSSLDDVSLSSLDSDSLVEIDLNDYVEDETKVDLVDSEVKEESDNDADVEAATENLVQEVSDLDIDADYDESRTQYELAKVFVDLGDQDGARKILNDIIDNRNNDDDVIADATTLLESIGS